MDDAVSRSYARSCSNSSPIALRKPSTPSCAKANALERAVFVHRNHRIETTDRELVEINESNRFSTRSSGELLKCR